MVSQLITQGKSSKRILCCIPNMGLFTKNLCSKHLFFTEMHSSKHIQLNRRLLSLFKEPQKFHTYALCRKHCKRTTIDGDDTKSLPKLKMEPMPPDPKTCCESGCVNCVWINYANEVRAFYPPEEREAKLKEILDTVEDYNVKMFLKMELDL